MRVRISDLHVRTREVELPERCSECGRAVVVDKLVTSKLMYLFQAKGDEEGTDFFMDCLLYTSPSPRD